MRDAAAIYSYVLIATVYGVLLGGTVRAAGRRERPAPQLGGRSAFYRNSIANLVILLGLTTLAVWLNPDLTAAGIGLVWPEGDRSDYLHAGGFLVLLVAACARSRRSEPPEATTALLPRTTGERWLAGGAAVAFGVSEEVIYRGLFLAVGTGLLGLPIGVAAVAGLVLFVAAHAHQDRRGLITVGLLGTLFTMAYLNSMSLVIPILAHVCWDAVALLLARRQPEPAAVRTVATAAVETEPEPERIVLRAATPS